MFADIWELQTRYEFNENALRSYLLPSVSWGRITNGLGQALVGVRGPWTRDGG